MINLQLDIQEVEALLKHIEQSAKSLITKVHAQASEQVAASQKAAEEPKEPQE